jgi:predicted dehydrogenase
VRKVKWGVLGVAKIAIEKVIPAMQQGEASHIAAIASRDLGKARAAAGKLGIERTFGSYEELLADPEIEAVYNPLPNELHVPWTLRALAAGKHVLCEKPIALDAKEARALIEARDRSGKLVAEAFMVRCHPQWRRAKELAATGAVGGRACDPNLLLLSPARPRECAKPAAGRRRAFRHWLLRCPVGALCFRRRADARGGDDRT